MDRAGNGHYWGNETRATRDKVNFQNYVKRDARGIQAARMAILSMSSAGTGALIGMAAGAPAGGLGAIPGAIIGGVVGFAAGASGIGALEYARFNQYRNSLEGRSKVEFDNIMSDREMVGVEYFCPITQSLIIEPVVIEGENHIYEKAALEEWVAAQGTNPMTRMPCNLNQIKKSLKGVARTGKCCDDILNDPIKRVNLTPVQLRTISLLRDVNLEIANREYDRTTNKMFSDVRSRKVTPKEFAAMAAQLADEMDPFIGEEANASRVEIDPAKIVLSPKVLAANGSRSALADEEKQ